MSNSMKKALTLLLTFSLFISIVGCSSEPTEGSSESIEKTSTSETRIITDVTGREVKIPVSVESIICLGSGAPRLAAYLDAMDMVVGAEEYIAQGVNIRRDYNPVHHDTLKELPFVGQGGGSGQNNGYPEEIIMAAPDVIVAGFDLEAADELQAQTGIPVVSVRHGTGLAPESFYKATRVFGDVIGAEKRAEMILDYVDSMLADLHKRTSDVSDSDKQRAYAGAVTWNGRRGFSGTYSEFGIFDAINAINVAEDKSIESFYEVDLEKILIWDPDVIFLDPGNMDLVNDEYAQNPSYFDSLQAVQEGKVYTMPAFNNAGTNFTYAFINAYYAGTVLFPEQFSDVDIDDKAKEILTTFLGENTYELMNEGGLYYGQITIGE
ncbi:ABC transporter substrate-binding protein [Proteinivorax hydrogeniformans]|uniref:ABC transporter substrate-binding protein n=1 Tax=Proteinivorax hydrogeniformans TaxID=1826727 RepID=A0AAU8HT67_9FIRM